MAASRRKCLFLAVFVLIIYITGFSTANEGPLRYFTFDQDTYHYAISFITPFSRNYTTPFEDEGLFTLSICNETGSRYVEIWIEDSKVLLDYKILAEDVQKILSGKGDWNGVKKFKIDGCDYGARGSVSTKNPDDRTPIYAAKYPKKINSKERNITIIINYLSVDQAILLLESFSVKRHEA
jgi:hypothetical protein